MEIEAGTLHCIAMYRWNTKKLRIEWVGIEWTRRVTKNGEIFEKKWNKKYYDIDIKARE